MKKVLSLAVAAALAAPVAAMADATVYGKVRVSVDSESWDNTVSVNGTDITGLLSAADMFFLEDEYGLRLGDGDAYATSDRVSRLGIKGSEDLGDGLKAIYKMEFGVNVGDSFSSLSGRNAYVGLSGDFGTALVGRHDTPLKMSTGKLDLFADTAADYDVNIVSDLRVDGALAYVSPKLGGWCTIAAANVTHPTGSEDFSDAFSIAGMCENGPFYASLAYEQHETGEDENLNRSISDMMGFKGNDSQTRLGLGLLDMSGFTATFVYEKREGIGMQDGSADPANDDDGWDSDAYMLAGAFKFTPNDQIKAMYGKWDGEDANSGATGEAEIDQWAIGYQHNFSNRTDAQILYTSLDAEISETVDGDVIEIEGDESIFSVQLNHAF